jgi:hypothetical protein
MVIFGSIIVAAYKSGLVHEKSKINAPKGIDENGSIAPTKFENAGATLEVSPTQSR